MVAAIGSGSGSTSSANDISAQIAKLQKQMTAIQKQITSLQKSNPSSQSTKEEVEALTKEIMMIQAQIQALQASAVQKSTTQDMKEHAKAIPKAAPGSKASGSIIDTLA